MKKAEIVQITKATKTSKNQCNHPAILQKFIKIAKGKKHQKTLRKLKNQSQNKKETLTTAGSEGKLLSGTWFKIAFTKVSGLSKCTNCCMTKLMEIPNTTE